MSLFYVILTYCVYEGRESYFIYHSSFYSSLCTFYNVRIHDETPSEHKDKERHFGYSWGDNSLLMLRFELYI